MTDKTDVLIGELNAEVKKRAETDAPLAALLARAADEIDFRVKLLAMAQKLHGEFAREVMGIVGKAP